MAAEKPSRLGQVHHVDDEQSWPHPRRTEPVAVCRGRGASVRSELVPGVGVCRARDKDERETGRVAVMGGDCLVQRT